MTRTTVRRPYTPTIYKSSATVCNLQIAITRCKTWADASTWRNRIKYRKRRIPINQNRKLPLSTADGHLYATLAHRLHTKGQTGYTTCQCMYSPRYIRHISPIMVYCCTPMSTRVVPLRNDIFSGRVWPSRSCECSIYFTKSYKNGFALLSQRSELNWHNEIQQPVQSIRCYLEIINT